MRLRVLTLVPPLLSAASAGLFATVDGVPVRAPDAAVDVQPTSSEHAGSVRNTGDAPVPSRPRRLVSDRFVRHRHPAVQRALHRRFATGVSVQDQNRRTSELFEFDEECLTDLDRYLQKELERVNDFSLEYDFFFVYSADFLAFLYKVALDQSEQDEYFGVDGQYTDEILQRMDDLERFYAESAASSPTSGTSNNGLDGQYSILLGAHGEALSDRQARISICFLARVDDTVDCESFADDLGRVIRAMPDQYDNPLMTLNAIVMNEKSLESLNNFDSSTVKPTIVFGDGMLDFMEESGARSEHDPDFVLAHEYCHVLQQKYDMIEYLDDGLDNVVQARMELMADAFASYYMIHASGANTTDEAIDDMLARATTIGDYEPAEAGFPHGSPGQRECAVRWGVSYVGNIPVNELDIVSGFMQDFDKDYDAISAGDPAVCGNLTGLLECTSTAMGRSSIESVAIVIGTMVIATVAPLLW